MAHYALLDENNVVVNIIVGRDEDEVVDGISDWEAYYGEFHGMTCKRTSYNTIGGQHRLGGTPYRYNYATIGGTFDPSVEPDGAFISEKLYPSSVLDLTTYTWKPPVPRPEDAAGADGASVKYVWYEPELNWVNIEQRPDLWKILYPDSNPE